MGVNSEEDRPLLVSFLDSARERKGSDDEAYMETKWNKPMSFKNRMRTAGRTGRGRARSMAQGAASIINKWPDHLLFCWLGSIAFILITVACLMMMMGLARNSATYINKFQEQCVQRNTHAARKDTTMKTNIYLHVIVNDNEMFEPMKFKSVLTSTIKYHPSFILNVFVLFNDIMDGPYKRNSRFKNWELYHKGLGMYKFFETPSAEVDDNTDVASIDLNDKKQFFANNNNIKIVQSTLSNYFKHSPLRAVWKTLPTEMIPVVIRVLTVWEHGGITLPIQMFLDKTNIYCQDKSANSKLHNLVQEMKRNFSDTVLSPGEMAKNKNDALNTFKNDLQGVSFEAGLNLESAKRAFKNLKGGRAQPVRTSSKSHDFMKINDSELTKSKSNDRSTSDPVFELKRALFEKHFNKVSGSNHSSQYESESYSSSYEYSSESSDGLPSSMESHSAELRLRPNRTSEYINNEISRYVNGNDPIKRTLESIERKSRIKRALYATPSEEHNDVGDRKRDTKIIERIDKVHQLNNALQNKNITSNEGIRKIKEALQRLPVLPKPILDFQKDYGSLEKKPETSSESESISYISIEDSDSASESADIQHDASSTIQRPKIKIREKTGYKHLKFFDRLNIFSMPTKLILSLDEAGYYLSTRRPCHAFLGQLISILQKPTNFHAADELISDGLKAFCRGRSHTECTGISLL